MCTLNSFSTNNSPRAILHIDGDAFFASCEQARNPRLKNKPVVTGKERGIAASMSYEAKSAGVTRGMTLREIKKICPQAVIIPSDYETYSLLSKRFFDIVRRYTPAVEEYSIDECFADITGMRRPLRMSYLQIAKNIQSDLTSELGFTFSVGLAPNKVLAKVASEWNKPAGFAVINSNNVEKYLRGLQLEELWGVGGQTSSYLSKLGIKDAWDFAQRSEEWVNNKLTKPGVEIWQELNCKYVMELEVEEEPPKYSVQKFKTFTPPSADFDYVFSQLCKNIENACIKLRRHNLTAKEVGVVLRSQEFTHSGFRARLDRATAFPNEIIKAVEAQVRELFDPNTAYRATGANLSKLNSYSPTQVSLFDNPVQVVSLDKIYNVVDNVAEDFGKHTLYLGSSYFAHNKENHCSSRKDIPQRQKQLFKGEDKRRRLGIPLLY